MKGFIIFDRNSIGKSREKARRIVRRILIIKISPSIEERGDISEFLFFAVHTPIISFPKSGESYEDVYHHEYLWPSSEKHLYHIIMKSNEPPIQTSDNQQ